MRAPAVLSTWTMVAAFCIGLARADLYTDCGSSLASVEGVEISGCDSAADICILHRNSNVTFTIRFTPNKEIKSLKTVVHGVMMNIPVPFPLPQPDACQASGLVCPLQPGQAQVYSSTMSVLKSYPKVKVDVKWELQAAGEQDAVCLMIPAQIK